MFCVAMNREMSMKHVMMAIKLTEMDVQSFASRNPDGTALQMIDQLIQLCAFKNSVEMELYHLVKSVMMAILLVKTGAMSIAGARIIQFLNVKIIGLKSMINQVYGNRKQNAPYVMGPAVINLRMTLRRT